MISAKDDEPQWVKDYYRKAVKWGFLAAGIGAAVSLIGGHLFAAWGVEFYLGGLIFPTIFVGLWFRRAYPPVRAWKEAWLKEHQIRTKEDAQRQ
ncbi:MAG: hypothetical protein OK452_08940 [Thaumarchaeota archaeon]|nr:hypothetical protein [Nitrososphaerota archaeon]